MDMADHWDHVFPRALPVTDPVVSAPDEALTMTAFSNCATAFEAVVVQA